jgi:lipopolysaccharide export system protein LptA
MRPRTADSASTVRSARALPATFTIALAVAALVSAGAAGARDSDRRQQMEISAAHAEGTIDGNGTSVMTGNVVITQGSLDIRADRADIQQRAGDPVRAVLTGNQAVMKQQMDDGSWMTAKADRIDYDMVAESIVLTGNYTVTTPRGSTRGQRLTYNLKTGRVDSGGEGSGRVSLTIVPKAAQQNAPAPQDKSQDKP